MSETSGRTGVAGPSCYDDCMELRHWKDITR